MTMVGVRNFVHNNSRAQKKESIPLCCSSMTDNPIFAVVDGAVPSGGDGGRGRRRWPERVQATSRGSCCDNKIDFDYERF